MDEQPTVSAVAGHAQPWPMLEWGKALDLDLGEVDVCQVQQLYVHPTLGPRVAVARQTFAPGYKEEHLYEIQGDLLLEIARFIEREERQANLHLVPPEPPQRELDFEEAA